MRRSVIIFLLLTTGTASAANVSQCKTSPKLVGPCFVVHGRLSVANGYWNHRIWPVGTQRMLAVVDSQDRYDENTVPLPSRIRKALETPETQVFADYEVCPLTRDRPGEMRHVCLAGASRISIRNP